MSGNWHFGFYDGCFSCENIFITKSCKRNEMGEKLLC